MQRRREIAAGAQRLGQSDSGQVAAILAVVAGASTKVLELLRKLHLKFNKQRLPGEG